MDLKNGELILNNHDLDHILDEVKTNEDITTSEEFYNALKVEVGLRGLDIDEYVKKVSIDLKSFEIYEGGNQ